MKCFNCGNTDSNTIKKLDGYYYYKCLNCGCEVEGTLITYPNGDFEFDDYLGDCFEVDVPAGKKRKRYKVIN